jgi:carbonic anhydrase
MDRIRTESDILRQMEDDKAIAIVGGLHDRDEGAVSFLK